MHYIHTYTHTYAHIHGTQYTKDQALDNNYIRKIKSFINNATDYI